MAEMLKIAVVGCGKWGRNLVRNFYSFGVLKTVCELNSKILAQIREKYPALNLTSSLEDLEKDPEIQGVVVSTPASTHYRIAKKFLRVGKDVFVEKPLALRIEEGEELAEMAVRNRAILMVGHVLQYHPAVIRLKQLIGKNGLGKIQYIYSNRLNIGRIRNEENILWSFAPHDISLLLSIVGQMPKNVLSFGGIYLPHKVEDVTLTLFSFPNGIKAHIFVSWLNPFKEQRFVVIGDEKMAVFDDTSKDRKLVLYHHKIDWSQYEVPTIEKAEGEIIGVEDKEPLKEEARHFLSCIKNRRKPLTDAEEGLRVLRVLEMAEKSLKGRKR